MKNLSKSLILSVFSATLLGFAAPALAATPSLSASYVNGSSSSVQLNVTYANAFSPITLNYRQTTSLWTSVSNIGQTDGSGNFNQVISLPSDGSSNAVYMYVTVGGLQSQTISLYPGSYNGGGCGYSGCGNGSGLTLSQSSVNLNVGQSLLVTASSVSYGYSNIYVSSNSNSSVASASVSGNQITVYGSQIGSTTISVCANGSTGSCASLYVTVGGSGSGCGYNGNCTGSLTFSPSSLNLSVGQTSTVTISYSVYNPSFYVSSNSNSSVATVTLLGSQMTVYGYASGSTNITVCSNSSACGTLYVTVGGGSYGGGNITFSPSSPTLYTGQSLAVSISSYAYNSGSYYGGTSNIYYVSSNSNPSVVSASVVGTVLNLYANQSGSSTITVCQNSLSYCGTLYVNVNGNGNGSGNVTLSQSSITLGVGQSSSVTAYSNYGSLYISSNSSASVVSASLSGSTLNLYGLANGTSYISVCSNYGSTYSNQCANLYVTVAGSGTQAYTVNVIDNAFSPKIITVPVGGTVTWLNNGMMNHTVTADDGSFNSNNLTPGLSFSRTFYAAGTYYYHCTYHGGSGGVGMSGTVVVTGNGGGGYNGGSLSLSQTNVSLSVGQTVGISVYGSGTYYVSSNSNSSVASASLTGSTLNVYGYQNGSTTVSICQNGYSNTCVSLYVTVGGYYSGGGGYGTLTFLTTSLPVMTVGQYYSYQLQASGGSSPYYFTLTSGYLPSGLTLSQNGLISGTSNGNPATFTIQVTDSYGRIGSASFSVSGTTNTGGGNVLGASTYPSGELISEGSTVYIVYKNTKTGFSSASVFRGLGFSFNNVIAVGNSGLSGSGYVVNTAFASHPWGSWIKNGQQVYFVGEAGLVPVPDWSTFINNGGQAAWIVNANTYDLRLPVQSIMALNDSRM